MSGRVGLREDARLGHLLARRIAGLFPRPEPPAGGADDSVNGRTYSAALMARASHACEWR